MRLTLNLEPELYAVAKSLAKAEDCSISAAVNRLLRRCLETKEQPVRKQRRPVKRNGFVIPQGKEPITADTLRRSEGGR